MRRFVYCTASCTLALPRPGEPRTPLPPLALLPSPLLVIFRNMPRGDEGRGDLAPRGRGDLGDSDLGDEGRDVGRGPSVMAGILGVKPVGLIDGGGASIGGISKVRPLTCSLWLTIRANASLVRDGEPVTGPPAGGVCWPDPGLLHCPLCSISIASARRLKSSSVRTRRGWYRSSSSLCDCWKQSVTQSGVTTLTVSAWAMAQSYFNCKATNETTVMPCTEPVQNGAGILLLCHEYSTCATNHTWKGREQTRREVKELRGCHTVIDLPLMAWQQSGESHCCSASADIVHHYMLWDSRCYTSPANLAEIVSNSTLFPHLQCIKLPFMLWQKPQCANPDCIWTQWETELSGRLTCDGQTTTPENVWLSSGLKPLTLQRVKDSTVFYKSSWFYWMGQWCCSSSYQLCIFNIPDLT